MENNEVEIVHWSVLKGDKYKTKIELEMLKLGGIKIENVCGLTGENSSVKWKKRKVIYDKDYVFSSVINLFKNLLEQITEEEFVELMRKVYRHSKNK